MSFPRAKWPIPQDKLRIDRGKLRIDRGKLRIDQGKLRIDQGKWPIPLGAHPAEVFSVGAVRRMPKAPCVAALNGSRFSEGLGPAQGSVGGRLPRGIRG